VAFTSLFDDDMPRSRIVGIFLAALELVRRGKLATRQDNLFDEIWLEPPPPRRPAPATSPPDAA
jgi:chromatin segregation and condensation protein Rec8/ScpA/Scc1 (kleisin family)